MEFIMKRVRAVKRSWANIVKTLPDCKACLPSAVAADFMVDPNINKTCSWTWNGIPLDIVSASYATWFLVLALMTVYVPGTLLLAIMCGWVVE